VDQAAAVVASERKEGGREGRGERRVCTTLEGRTGEIEGKRRRDTHTRTRARRPFSVFSPPSEGSKQRNNNNKSATKQEEQREILPSEKGLSYMFFSPGVCLVDKPCIADSGSTPTILWHLL